MKDEIKKYIDDKISELVKQESIKLNAVVIKMNGGYHGIRYIIYDYEEYKSQILPDGEPIVIEKEGMIKMIIGNHEKSIEMLWREQVGNA